MRIIRKCILSSFSADSVFDDYSIAYGDIFDGMGVLDVCRGNETVWFMASTGHLPGAN
jgi:hypothetical protein